MSTYKKHVQEIINSTTQSSPCISYANSLPNSCTLVKYEWYGCVQSHSSNDPGTNVYININVINTHMIVTLNIIINTIAWIITWNVNTK